MTRADGSEAEHQRAIPGGAPDGALAWFPAEDECLAARSEARLLITVPTSRGAEAVARRIHRTSARGRFRFLRTEAGDVPVAPRMLKKACSTWLDDAAGGTLFMNDVEAMPSAVQGRFVELLDELALTRPASAAVRLVSGTTVSLFDRVVAGAFSKALFYRLNVIHLLAGATLAEAEQGTTPFPGRLR